MDETHIIPTRIAEAMADARLSQAKLAHLVGVSPAAIQQILNGTTKRSKYLPEIAASLNVDPNWLEGRSENKGTVTLHEIVRSSDEYSITETWDIRTKFYRDGEAEIGIGELTVPNELLRNVLLPDGVEHLLVVSDSTDMAPTIMPGETMFAKRMKDFDESFNAVWIVNLNDRPVIRRVTRSSPTEYLLNADNPSVASVRAGAELVCFEGKVAGHLRRL
jgi:transcriptional regulator with XRE-family HTH domain